MFKMLQAGVAHADFLHIHIQLQRAVAVLSSSQQAVTIHFDGYSIKSLFFAV